MIRKILILLITLFPALAGLFSQFGFQPDLTDPILTTSTPAVIQMLPTVEAETQMAVLQALQKIIPPDKPFIQHSGENFLTVSALVSTGITQTVPFPLDDQTIQIDYLWAYDRTNRGIVTRLPVAFGLGYPDGRYEYFSNTLFYTRQFEGLDTAISRDDALEDLQMRLPRGRIFSVTFYQAVTPEKIVWRKCPEAIQARGMSGGACAVGEWMDQRYPDALGAFIRRNEKTVPQGWILAGWYFTEADETFVLRDVILPEE